MGALDRLKNEEKLLTIEEGPFLGMVKERSKVVHATKREVPSLLQKADRFFHLGHPPLNRCLIGKRSKSIDRLFSKGRRGKLLE